MLASNDLGPLQSETLRKILRLLEGLTRTSTGQVLFDHVQQMLEDYEASRAEVERSYSSLTCLLLDAFSTHLPANSSLLAQIKALQLRLAPPLSAAEVEVLHHYMEHLADAITQFDHLPLETVQAALGPLLREFGFHLGDDPGGFERRGTADRRGQPERRSNVHYLQNAIVSIDQEGESEGDRSFLDQYEDDLRQLKSTLSGALNEAVAQSEEFSVLLEVELAALREVDNIAEFERKKETLLSEMEKTLRGQRQLRKHFDRLSNYLSLVETDSRRLSAELSRAMVLSLTDELTGLPNRRAFLQRLEDEISRAQRYSNVLSLAVVDIDKFKPVNDVYGHAAGDAVLRKYAQDILSQFRYHDLAARYGGEEFAVIFPNTDAEGVVQALKNVQLRLKGAHVEFEGESIPLPTFSAGVAVYDRAETMNQFVQRADEALYNAKRAGRNCIEMAQAAADSEA